MNCFLRAPFAAIGAFVDALHPVDMTRAERMLVDREAEEDVAEAPDMFRSGGQTYETGPRPRLSTSHGGKCRCGHWLHCGNICAACGCNDVRLPNTSADQRKVADSSAGVSVKQSAPPVEHPAAIPPAAADLAGGSPLSPPARSLTYLPPVGPSERRCVCTEPIRWHDPMGTWVHTGRNPSCGNATPS